MHVFAGCVKIVSQLSCRTSTILILFLFPETIFRRVLILLEVQVLAKGSEIEGKIGNPQPFKPGQPSSAPPQTNGSAASNPPPAQNTAPASSNGGPLRRPPPSNPYNKGKLHFVRSVYT